MKNDVLTLTPNSLAHSLIVALFTNKVQVPTVNYIYGIGGRDTTEMDIEKVYMDLKEIANGKDIGNPYRYLGVRGDEKDGI